VIKDNSFQTNVNMPRFTVIFFNHTSIVKLN